jgi:hypothetical protein
MRDEVHIKKIKNGYTITSQDFSYRDQHHYFKTIDEIGVFLKEYFEYEHIT